MPKRMVFCLWRHRPKMPTTSMRFSWPSREDCREMPKREIVEIADEDSKKEEITKEEANWENVVINDDMYLKD